MMDGNLIANFPSKEFFSTIFRRDLTDFVFFGSEIQRLHDVLTEVP